MSISLPMSIFTCRTPDVKVCTENQVVRANGVPLQQAVYIATGLLVFKMISTYVPGLYLKCTFGCLCICQKIYNSMIG